MIISKVAEPEDATEIVELLRELGYETKPDLVSRRISNIKTRKGEVILALNEDREILGCVHVFVDLRLAEGEVGEIVSLVVKSEMRGQGIGKYLVRQACRWLTNQGCPTARVRANTVREKAHQFYENRGFKQQKTQKVFQMDL